MILPSGKSPRLHGNGVLERSAVSGRSEGHMIINTGQRTDIPAFYAEWFANRLREGVV